MLVVVPTKGWRGFGPGADAPLLPCGKRRHVALYRCSCGVAGCGVILPARPRHQYRTWFMPTELRDIRFHLE